MECKCISTVLEWVLIACCPSSTCMFVCLSVHKRLHCFVFLVPQPLCKLTKPTIFSLDCDVLLWVTSYTILYFISFCIFITKHDDLQGTSNLWFRFSTRLISYFRVLSNYIWHEKFRKLLQISVSCKLLQFHVNSRGELSATFMVYHRLQAVSFSSSYLI